MFFTHLLKSSFISDETQLITVEGGTLVENSHEDQMLDRGTAVVSKPTCFKMGLDKKHSELLGKWEGPPRKTFSPNFPEFEFKQWLLKNILEVFIPLYLERASLATEIPLCLLFVGDDIVIGIYYSI